MGVGAQPLTKVALTAAITAVNIGMVKKIDASFEGGFKVQIQFRT